jgi:membrane-associated phospholipid phosphatase
MKQRHPEELPLSEWERRALIKPLQRNFAVLDGAMKLLGMSVNGESILPFFSVLYWCADQHKCVAGIWLVPLSEAFNCVVKWQYRRARPAWMDPDVRLLSWSSEYSFPSSHSQLAWAVAHFMVAASSHPEAVTTSPALLCYGYAALVALSRVHCGIHYPSDVLVGSAWGLGTSVIYARLLPTLLPTLRRLLGGGESGTPAPSRLLASLSLPCLITAACLAIAYRRVLRHRHKDDENLHKWKKNACRGKHEKRELDPVEIPLGTGVAMCGVLAGLAIGEAFKQHVPLAYPASRRAAWARAVLGNVGLLAMFISISELTPKRPVALYQTLRFIRYALVPIFILLIAPPAFNRLGL